MTPLFLSQVVYIKNAKRWGEAAVEVCEELGLEGVDPSDCRLLRLRPLTRLEPYKHAHGSVPQLFPEGPEVLVGEVQDLGGAMVQVDIKPHGTGWKAAPPVAADGLSHVHFSDVDGGLDVKNHFTVPKGTPFEAVRERIGLTLQIPQDLCVRVMCPVQSVELSGLGVSALCADDVAYSARGVRSAVAALAAASEPISYKAIEEFITARAGVLPVYAGPAAPDYSVAYGSSHVTSRYSERYNLTVYNLANKRVSIYRKSQRYDAWLRRNVTSSFIEKSLSPNNALGTPEYHTILAYAGAEYEICDFSSGFSYKYTVGEAKEQAVFVVGDVAVVD
eukprot:SAG11_NODE_5114_length_1659_cov_1.295513_2_plen_332_part_01